MEMTIDQANAKARELYGHRARALVNLNGLLDIVISESHGLKGVNMLLGWGSTWEEAFQRAQARTQLPLVRAAMEQEYSMYTKPSQIEMF